MAVKTVSFKLRFEKILHKLIRFGLCVQTNKDAADIHAVLLIQLFGSAYLNVPIHVQVTSLQYITEVDNDQSPQSIHVGPLLLMFLDWYVAFLNSWLSQLLA